MKTHVITISRKFPATHKRKGEPTYFVEGILNAMSPFGLIDKKTSDKHDLELPPKIEKIHTLRANYKFWAKRITEVQLGHAILSLRYWYGKPYRSHQVEFARLDSKSGIGIQALYFEYERILEPFILPEDSHNGIQTYLVTHNLAVNDGLIYPDFKEWFKKYRLNKPLAIIHFTGFRY